MRTRLLAAFVALFCAALLLAAASGLASRRIEAELAGVEQDLLPQVFNALALSERASRFAATASRLVESVTPIELETRRLEAESLLAQIRQGAQAMHGPSAQPEGTMARLQAGLEDGLPELAARSRTRLSYQAELETDLARLDALGRALQATGRSARLSTLWSTLVVGTAVNDGSDIGRLESDAEALLLAARRHGDLAKLSDGQVQELLSLASGPTSTLARRHAIIELDAHLVTLLALTRLDASEMGTQATRHVAWIEQSTTRRRERLEGLIRAGKLAMLALSAISLCVAVLATRYVRRLVGDIEVITASMSRLARGDTAPGTRAMGRPDELGELARSFEVFRETLLAKQGLVRDLDAQRDLLQAVHDNLTDALAVFDRDDRLILWNGRMDLILARQGAMLRAGVVPEEIFASLPSATTWQRQGRRRRETGLMETLARQAWLEADHLELTTPDGQVLDLRSCPMPDGGTVTLIADLSMHRATQSQLQQAQKLEMLGQFTGGVAHDFNNYLATILGNLDLLEDVFADEESRRVQWQRVRRAATRAAGLTRRLLAFARRQPLHAEDVLLSDVIAEMMDLVEYSAGDAVAVHLDLALEAFAIHVDRGQLENALLNLVINSAAAMPDGGVLEIATRRIPAPDGRCEPWVEIVVRDTGVGMSDVEAARAFEPFFSTKPAGQGSGLGLAIVYGFVRQSGGDVALRSRHATGTEVMLRFPALVDVPGIGPKPSASPSTAQPPLGQVLLLVEDDEAFRATLIDLLRRLDIEVVAVADAGAGLRALESGLTVNGVLSDIRLGKGMDGQAFALLLAARWPALPVLLMSGEVAGFHGEPNATHEDAATTRTEPAVPHFLQKPFEAAPLVAWLRSLSTDA